MCVIYTIRFLCNHLVHLDDPPVTPCSEVKPIGRNRASIPPGGQIYCTTDLVPTIIPSDQVCPRCNAGFLAYAHRVYDFEVRYLMSNMPIRVDIEEEMYFGAERTGTATADELSLDYYHRNIIDRILPPALLMTCWTAWRAERERFRHVGIRGGSNFELGRGFIFTSPGEHLGGCFPQTYVFDTFLGDTIPDVNLSEILASPAEKALQLKLQLLDAVVEARCLYELALRRQAAGADSEEWSSLLERARVVMDQACELIR